MNASPRVLLIDDDPMLVGLLQHKLRANDYQVETARDGETGLDAARAKRPDIIVLDLMLPGMDGRQVLRELKSNPSLAHIPVVVLTARRTESDVVDGLKSGASDYLSKPFSPDELVARLARLAKSPA